MGAGEAGDKLEKYTRLLKTITGKKPIQIPENVKFYLNMLFPNPGLAVP